MGINEIKKEILDNAKIQAKLILNEAEKEQKEIESAAQARIDEIAQSKAKEAEFEIESYRTVSMAEAYSISKKRKLSLEAEVFEDVLEKAKYKISNLSSKAREAHLSKLLKDTKGFTKVYCSKKDMELIKKSKPQQMELLGGVMLENSEGNIRQDLSYESMLASLKQEKLAEISKILFS